MSHPDDAAPERAVAVDGFAAAERLLAHEIRGFLGELCLLDGGVLVGWVRAQRHGNIADLVSSSAELFFKEATLSYADAADVSVDWGRSMRVILDMEFVAEPVTVFFKLVLDACFVGVAIQRILFDPDRPLPLDGFAHALAGARLAPSGP